MPDDWVTRYIEKRLWYEVNSVSCGVPMVMLTLGTSNESGLKRVPLEGPPTWANDELYHRSQHGKNLQE